MLRQITLLNCITNRLLRIFNKCSKMFSLNYVRVCDIVLSLFWTQHKTTTFSKIPVAYMCNNVYDCAYRKVLGLL